MKKIFSLCLLLCLLVLPGACLAQSPVWGSLLEKYRTQDKVRQLIFVQYTGRSDAHVLLYQKDAASPGGWRQTLACEAYVGENGIGKTIQGDCRTPEGDYGMITAFGIKPNPGTSLPYVDVDDHIWCAGDEVYYNSIVDDRVVDLGDDPSGEHMADYAPEYNYGFFFDYNKERIIGKGSALFFHCQGHKTDTLGCIAVPEADMITLLRSLDSNARLCVFDY